MSTLWFRDTDDDFEEDLYHDNPSYLSSSDPGEAAGPLRKSIFDLHSAQSAAWKTLATSLLRAAPLPALVSLLQHHVFTEPWPFSYFRKKHSRVVTARLKYLQVKKSKFDPPYLLNGTSHIHLSGP